MKEPTSTICEILTPEGVPLQFRVGTAGDRVVAFLMDVAVIAAAMLAIVLPLFLTSRVFGGELLMAVALVVFFFLRNFYFIFFELRASGTTFGKRRLGLRVIARDGGPLTAEMIFARNLTRDLEVFLPLMALTSPEMLVPGGRGLGVVIAIAWVLAFALLPLFNRKRLRCGDIIGGTIVVCEPKAALLPDLAETNIDGRSASPWAKEAEYTFTPKQLEVYGIKELQVLEDLFRRLEEGQGSVETMRIVCEKIRRKIGWPKEELRVLPFLRDFYRAQRAHLERGLLFGKRKESKSSKGDGLVRPSWWGKAKKPRGS